MKKIIILLLVNICVYGKIIKPWITTDKSVNTYNLQTIVNSLIKQDMTNEEKAIAIWDYLKVILYHHGVRGEDLTDYYGYDAIRIINLYGYSMCKRMSDIQMNLWSLIPGFQIRGIGFKKPEHASCEVWYKDKDEIERWHWIDIDLTAYVYTRDKTRIANLDDIKKDSAIITDRNIRKTSNPFFPHGGDVSSMPPAVAEGAHTYMAFEKNKIDLPAIHKMDITLYQGMKYILKWDNKERKFYWPRSWAADNNVLRPAEPGGSYHECGTVHSWMPDWAKLYGNPGYAVGRLEYKPDFTSSSFLDGVYYKNKQEIVGLSWFEKDRKKPNLHPEKPNQLGYVIFRIQTPYILADAEFEGTFIKKTQDDINKVYISTDKARSWDLVWTNNSIGENKIKINFGYTPYTTSLKLPTIVTGKYDYLIKFEFLAKENIENSGINDLEIITLFNMNKLTLPHLSFGDTEIKVILDNPEELSKCDFKIKYAWAKQSTSSTIETFEKKITESPCSYKIHIEDNKEPIMKYIEYSVGYGKVEPIDFSRKIVINSLYQSYPNPFNPECYIPYELKDNGDVKIRIYNVLGQKIRELNLGQKQEGRYITKDKAAYWDGRDSKGKESISGVYYYEMVVDDKIIGMKKSLVLK